jgi:hypothetical protein
MMSFSPAKPEGVAKFVTCNTKEFARVQVMRREHWRLIVAEQTKSTSWT